MKKKILTAVLILVAIALVVAGVFVYLHFFPIEEETPDIGPHEHVYTETVIPPTCTEDGYTEKKCECSHTVKTDVVASPGHSFGEWVETKAPTEEEKGEETRTCTVCGDTETRETETLLHTHVYNTVSEPATCTENGYSKEVCACGDEQNVQTLTAPGHSFGSWTVIEEATESKEGKEERTCSVCKEKETRKIDKVTHTHSYTYEKVDATCTDEGYTLKSCSCGYEEKTSVKAALGHDYGSWVITKKATLTSTGTKKHTCERCKHVETATVAKLVSLLSTYKAATVSGQTLREVFEPYPGVIRVHYKLGASSTYGLQDFHILEFNPKQDGLYFHVTSASSDITVTSTVSNTVNIFNRENPDLKAIAAINGDLWMVTYAHARVLGSGTSYGGYKDAVVTASFNLPRSYNVYDGEIVTSTHIPQETPYEDEFYSFGITPDGEALLGKITTSINIRNTTQNTRTSAHGINRLPADNAMILYTHAVTYTRSLSDAYEIVIDCGNYKVTPGCKLTGTVKAIYGPNSSGNPTLSDTTIVLTARGSCISWISDYKVGDKVEIDVRISDVLGNTAKWLEIENAVGGHIPVMINGTSTNPADNSRIPTTFYGIKANGNVVLLINDGRQSGYSQGLKISQLDELCKELGIVTAFISDGGGSTTLIEIQSNGSYKLINKPSDGSQRQVVGTVILAVDK